MVSITEEVAAVVFDLSSFLAIRDIPCVAFSALWTFFVDVSVCAVSCDILVVLSLVYMRRSDGCGDGCQ